MKKTAIHIFIASLLLLFAGCAKEMDVPQSDASAGDDPAAGMTVSLSFEVAHPDSGADTKVVLGDAGLSWTGSEEMTLVFGKKGAEGKDFNPKNPVKVSSSAPGVFEGTVTIPSPYTIEDLHGIVVPSECRPMFDWSSSSVSYLNIPVALEQQQQKAGEPNWTYFPFFCDLTSVEAAPDNEGKYQFEGLKMKAASDMIAFNVYGAREQNEKLESVTVRVLDNTCAFAGYTLWSLGSTGTGIANGGKPYATVSLTEQSEVPAAKEDGLKVYMAYLAKNNRTVCEVHVKTDKAEYIKGIRDVVMPKTDVNDFCVYPINLNLATFSRVEAQLYDRVLDILKRALIPSIQICYTHGDEMISFCVVNDELYQSASLGTEASYLTSRSIYQTCSIGKVPMAYMALKLQEEGKFDLNEPLYKYWGDDDATNEMLALFADDASKEKAKQITGLMALTHMTGLNNSTYSNISYTDTPGAKYVYSGPAIHLVDLTLGKILGKSLNEYAREYIFDKIGMPDTDYNYTDSRYKLLAAYGYYPYDSSSRYRNTWAGNPNAAYTLRSSAEEFTKFVRWTMDGMDLTKESVDKMFENLVTVDEAESHYQNLVWQTRVHPELGTIRFHTGNNGCFKGWMAFFPDLDKSLCFFINSDTTYGYAQPIIKLFMGNTTPVGSAGSGLVPGTSCDAGEITVKEE